MNGKKRVAVIGAGVSGLTCAVVFAENGYETTIWADEIGDETNSAAAAAMWYPYDVGSTAEIIPWALVSYRRFLELTRDSNTGVSVIDCGRFPGSVDHAARLVATFAPPPSLQRNHRRSERLFNRVPLLRLGNISSTSVRLTRPAAR